MHKDPGKLTAQVMSAAHNRDVVARSGLAPSLYDSLLRAQQEFKEGDARAVRAACKHSGMQDPLDQTQEVK